MIDHICWHRPSAKRRERPPSLLAQVDAEIDEARSQRQIGQRRHDRDVEFADDLISSWARKAPAGVVHRIAATPISKKVGMARASDKRTRLSSPSLYAPCSHQREYNSRCQNSEVNLIG
jgi:hypothetical protein